MRGLKADCGLLENPQKGVDLFSRARSSQSEVMGSFLVSIWRWEVSSFIHFVLSWHPTLHTKQLFSVHFFGNVVSHGRRTDRTDRNPPKGQMAPRCCSKGTLAVVQLQVSSTSLAYLIRRKHLKHLVCQKSANHSIQGGSGEAGSKRQFKHRIMSQQGPCSGQSEATKTM